MAFSIIFLPLNYSFNVDDKKILENSCLKNSDCETPGEYLI